MNLMILYPAKDSEKYGGISRGRGYAGVLLYEPGYEFTRSMGDGGFLDIGGDKYVFFFYNNGKWHKGDPDDFTP